MTAFAALLLSAAAGAGEAPPPALQTEQAELAQWRAARLQSLTSETGWLNLVGLLWLKDGDNGFGRGAGNALVLDNAALAENAGTFVVHNHTVTFRARPGAGITHHGEPVTQIAMTSDAAGEPTVVSSGPLRFFIIERAGHLGVRVRDLDSPRRRNFSGLDYFPVSTAWNLTARFEPYQPVRHLKIINILGIEEDAQAPGALVFSANGQEWRLDAILESPGDTHLFVMFQDGTSGHETYGGGRFMEVPLPVGGLTQLDFNKAFNPPCALNDFATCPLPPPGNRLKLRVEAGELAYGDAHHPP
ncbi:MAG TPA: DUF1684 domain-containing protein [Steroidobacteraceae bacterium]